MRAAFSDIAPTLGPTLAEGDLVAVRVEAHGSHTCAPFPPGIPATGKSITWKKSPPFPLRGRIAEDGQSNEVMPFRRLCRSESLRGRTQWPPL